MMTRSRDTRVTFRRTFMLAGLDSPQPPGTYRVVIDEEEIPDVSRLVYRRVATLLHVPALAAGGRAAEVFAISADDLATALEADLRD